jgi:hypothetical protein
MLVGGSEMKRKGKKRKENKNGETHAFVGVLEVRDLDLEFG